MRSWRGWLVALLLAVSAGAAQVPAQPAPITFDRYHGYRDIQSALERLAAAYPELARVSSIGRDLRGFDLWMIEITNQKTGPADEKPAVFADGNMDGDAPGSTEVLLELIQRVLTRHGTDPAITQLLDTTSLYLVPMSNPFMADQYVSTAARIRSASGTNARPRDDDRDQRIDEDPAEDLDGDGQIVMMRVRAPSGPFRTDPKNPRLVVRRAGTEIGEWMLYTEGIDNDRDGRINEDPIGGVDLNRNFPFEWQPEAVQEGAGEFALSEPEARAIAEFMNAHSNVGLVLNGHGGAEGGQVLRVFGARADAAVPKPDLESMSRFAASLKDLGGAARMISPYGEAAMTRFGRLEYGFGMFTDWAYEMHGAIALAPEPAIAAGDLNGDGQVSDAELLKLSDAEFAGRLFVPWKTYPHPTLGRVEIGGFVKMARPNPPPGKYLEKLARTYADLYLAWASSLPRLTLRDVSTAEEFGGVTIHATVENLGSLPTNVTERSIVNRSAKPVTVTLTVSPGVTILGETARQEMPFLAGAWAASGDRSKALTWAVRPPATGGPHWAEIVVTSGKAGTLRRRISF